MAQDLEQLVLSISADTAQMRRALKRLEGDVNSSTRKVERQFDGLGRKISRSFDGIGRSLRGSLAGLASAFTLREAQSLIDSATRIENALKVVGLSGTELTGVYDRLYESATKNAAPIESLVTLFSRASLVQKELGVSTEELIQFTDRVAMALRVSGQSAEASRGALLQLGQALSTNVVRAEEYNSLQEGAVPILRAVAAGLKEAGGSVGTLTNLVKNGEVTSEAFFRAFEAGAPLLEGQVANSVFTIDQRLTNLQTALIDAAGRFNESTAAAETFGAQIDRTAAFVNSINFETLISEIGQVIAQFQSGAHAARDFALWAGRASGLENIGAAITGGTGYKDFLGGAITVTSSKGIENRINEAFAGQIEQAGTLTAEAIRNSVLGEGGASTPPKTGRLPAAPKVTPVSLTDFAAPDAKGGKGKSAKERADEYERLTQRIIDSTVATVAETEAQRQLNPLIDDYGFAAEKARMERELLTAAEEAGKAITPQLRAEIAALSEQYALAGAESAKLAESQDELRERMEEMRDLGKDVMGGFISDMIEGKSASEALANALGKVGDKLLEIALNDLFKGGDGGGGFLGLLGGLFGGGGGISLHNLPGNANGTDSWKGGPTWVGERGPEIVNLPRRAQVVPNHEIGGGAISPSPLRSTPVALPSRPS